MYIHILSMYEKNIIKININCMLWTTKLIFSHSNSFHELKFYYETGCDWIFFSGMKLQRHINMHLSGIIASRKRREFD